MYVYHAVGCDVPVGQDIWTDPILDIKGFIMGGSTVATKNHCIEDLRGSYWITRVVFLRCIAFIYAVAFSVALLQNKQLIGDRGLLPLSLFMKRITAGLDEDAGLYQRLITAPTIFWVLAPNFENVDWLLDAVSWVGLTLAITIFIMGAANVVMMSILWVLYISIVTVGQTWYSFGWESLLLEVGFLAVWAVPVFSVQKFPINFPTPWLLVNANRWLLFRVMLGAGLIKIRGGISIYIDKQ